MDYITLGATGITVNKNGFGALPIQRISEDDAATLLRKAYNSGITFFDTGRAYTDSEKKIGIALSDVRDKIYISTKTMARDAAEFRDHLDASLDAMKTDYIDIHQFHNPKALPRPGDETGLYDAMLEAKAAGKVRHIGITEHKLAIAREALESGLYETIQYPFSYLATDDEIAFVRDCERRGVGVIAMKALSGGLITNSAAAYAYLSQFSNVLPIWGIQREHELMEFLSYQDSPPVLDDAMRDTIARDRAELSGSFCRSCGYCMPCPVGIEIPTAARMSLLLRRAPLHLHLNDDWKAQMPKVDDCLDCGQCKARCPYGLDTPALLRANWEDYKTFM